ncbi:alpha/beta fold hydrolase [Halomonas piscis]|uniref:Alpha/beta fold hydrolase n=1 Tax=Halomonas piscis TaxID=3031727 RepID=A0ABY9YWM8_9GAMM|nr:alpha/beta fold hydrolase [Halomonas piscis]WNK18860.1 alpha/beta fold hydrolase [Halomonas piscis]
MPSAAEPTPVELYCIDSGEDDGSELPLVVIHGLLGSADNWRSHLRDWRRGRRVIAVDLRNHGRSPHADGMDYTAMSDDVLALLDRLSLERAHVLGHSMGGKVAMSLACRKPQRVASLIVADIAPVAYRHGHDDIFAAMRELEQGRPADRREADALLARHIDSRPIRLFLATNLQRAEGEMTLRIGLDRIIAGYPDIIAPPTGESAFDGPAMVLRGAESDYVQDAMLPRLREVLPKARVVTLKGAGHWLHAEQPQAFQQAVNTFLAAHPHGR